MTPDRFDEILERLDAVLETTENEEVRHELREVQQLIVGVRWGLPDGVRADVAEELRVETFERGDGDPTDGN